MSDDTQHDDPLRTALEAFAEYADPKRDGTRTLEELRALGDQARAALAASATDEPCTCRGSRKVPHPRPAASATDEGTEPCLFGPPHEPFYCRIHGDVRLTLTDERCRTADGKGRRPLAPNERYAASATDEGPSLMVREAIAEDNLRLAMDALHRPAVPEALDGWKQATRAIASVSLPRHLGPGAQATRRWLLSHLDAALRSKEPTDA